MKYPTRNGIALNPYELGYTPTERIRRETTNHHWHYTRERYRDIRYRSVFRNLVSHVSPLFIEEHTDLHRKYQPPVMPPDSLMIETIQDYLDEHGQIDCVREKKTHEVYQIYEDEWQLIKGLYRRAA